MGQAIDINLDDLSDFELANPYHAPAGPGGGQFTSTSAIASGPEFNRKNWTEQFHTALKAAIKLKAKAAKTPTNSEGWAKAAEAYRHASRIAASTKFLGAGITAGDKSADTHRLWQQCLDHAANLEGLAESAKKGEIPEAPKISRADKNRFKEELLAKVNAKEAKKVAEQTAKVAIKRSTQAYTPSGHQYAYEAHAKAAAAQTDPAKKAYHEQKAAFHLAQSGSPTMAASLDFPVEDLALASDDGDGCWITANGTHIFIKGGEDQHEQVRKFLATHEGKQSRDAELASKTAYGHLKESIKNRIQAGKNAVTNKLHEGEKAVTNKFSAFEHGVAEKYHKVAANLHEDAADAHGLMGHKEQSEYHKSQALAHVKEAEFHHGEVEKASPEHYTFTPSKAKGEEHTATVSGPNAKAIADEGNRRIAAEHGKERGGEKKEGGEGKEKGEKKEKEHEHKEPKEKEHERHEHAEHEHKERTGGGGMGGVREGYGGGQARGNKNKKAHFFKANKGHGGKGHKLSLSLTKLEDSEESVVFFPGLQAEGCEELELAEAERTTADGKPKRRFRKEVIYTGQFVKPSPDSDLHFEVTDDTLKNWTAVFSDMKQDGVKVYMPAGHTNKPDSNRGWVENFEIAPSKHHPEKNALYMVADVIGDDGLALVGRSDVSLYSPGQLKAGNGKTYKRPIVHVAVCTDPVIPGLGEWEAIAASLTPWDEKTDKVLELAEAPVVDDPGASGEDASPLLDVLAILTAQRQSYHSSHWASMGDDQYANHLLFERLYNAADEDIDPMGEKIRGIFGAGAVNAEDVTRATQEYVDEWGEEPDLKRRGVESEIELQDTIHEALMGPCAAGTENLLQGIADHSDTRLVLLQGAGEETPQGTELSQGSNTTTLPKGASMNIATICEKLAIPTNQVTAENAESLILAGIDKMAADFAAEKESMTLSLSQNTTTEPAPASPAMVRLVHENRTMKLNNLITGGNITPVVAKELAGVFNNPESLQLSLNNGDDHFDDVITILAQNKPVPLAEQTGPQTKTLKLARHDADGKGDDDEDAEEKNPLMADANKRIKEAQDRAARTKAAC